MSVPGLACGATRILAALLEARTGQQILAQRSWRVEAALKPLMREHELADLDALAARIAQPGEAALGTAVVEALLNNESSFFRDVAVFDQLDRVVFEELRRERATMRRLRLWSAGCATGQEAYSLAMQILGDAVRWTGWRVEIVGTDVSASAVARAVAGSYSAFEIQRGLPVRTMLRWFEPQGDQWVADPQLRRAVRFSTHSLFEPALSKFDLILCRNVMMYLPEHHRRTVFARLDDALEPGGMLILGAGETVIGQTDSFVTHPNLRGVYARGDDKESPRVAASR